MNSRQRRVSRRRVKRAVNLYASKLRALRDRFAELVQFAPGFSESECESFVDYQKRMEARA